MHIACPFCNGLMVGDQIAIGTPVICPHCRNQFLMNEAILAAAIQPAPSPQPTAQDRGAASTPAESPPGGAAVGPAREMPSPRPAPPRDAGPAPSPAPAPQPQASAPPGMHGPAPAAPRTAAARTAATDVAGRARSSFGIEHIMVLLLIVGGAGIAVVGMLVGLGRESQTPRIKEPEPLEAQGPHLKVSYSNKTISIVNCDPFAWRDVEIRINPDPADNEGGYRLHHDRIAAGRRKRFMLGEFLGPSGRSFSGRIDRVVVEAAAGEGRVTYVSAEEGE